MLSYGRSIKRLWSANARINRLIVLGFLLAGPFITIPKLHFMAQVTGRLPGRVLYSGIVTSKEITPGWLEPYCGLTWRIPNVPGVGPVEGNDRAEQDDWQRLNVGSAIPIAFAHGKYMYTRSVFVSPGQFVFDNVLIVLEALAWLLAIRYLIKRFAG